MDLSILTHQTVSTEMSMLTQLTVSNVFLFIYIPFGLFLLSKDLHSFLSRMHLISTQFCLFANGLGDLGSIPGRIIPKTLKMVLDTSLLNTQQYKVCIKGKVEQSKERSSALPYTSV